LLPVLAEASAQVAGAVRATATLHGLTGPDRVASWPAAQAPATATGTVVCVPVRDVHGTLGEISVEMPAGRALRAGERAVLEDLAGQAGFAFRNVRLEVELAERVEELRGRTGDLVESRRRLITAGDAERRRIERAIADTVVSHLEPLPGALHRLATEGSTIQGEALGPVLAGSGAALEALRDLTRGVFPAQLARGGLGPALTSYLGTADSAGHLRLDPSVTGRRFDERVEAAGYVCVTEAVRQLPPPVQVSVAVRDDWLELRIGGHCSGEFALSHVRDRVEVAGGTLSEVVVSDQVTLDVRLPAGREDVVPAQKRPGANAPVSRG
jgi:signal transduction histidine kinase